MALFNGSSYDVITKYLPEAVDEYFVTDSKTVILENGSKFIDVNFNEAGYVKIASFLLDGLSDYYKTQVEPRPASPDGFAAYAGNLGSGERDGFDIGGTDVTWEIFKLQWCRGRQFRIDHIADEETGRIVTGGLIEKFHKEKVIPEVDACRFSVIADAASVSLGNLVTEVVGTDITAANILSRFFAIRKYLVESEVPLEDLVWFVKPAVYELIVNSSELTRYITQEDYRSDKGLEFKVTKFNGTPIIEVPSSRFFTDVVTTRNGFQASASSKNINYMMCSAKAIVPIRKIEYSKVYGEDLTGLAGYYGTMMNYLLYHGVVIPRNKLIGVYVSVGSAEAAPETNVLLVDLRAGEDTGSTILKAFFTRPSALRGTVVCSTSAFTVGATVSDIDDSQSPDLNPVSWKVGSQKTIVASDSSTISALYFGLVDYRGVCIAKSGSVTLVKKA